MKSQLKNSLIRFIPAYVGSKAYWIPYLERFRDSNIVEFFAGSASISANLAKTAYLNDTDAQLINIFRNYDKLVIPDSFTKEDYFVKRKEKDWYRYIFILQKLSYFGVFRYSKNGYNVPLGGDPASLDFSQIKINYQRALQRFNELKPTVTCGSYVDFSKSLKSQYGVSIEKSFFKDKVVICDPPYFSSNASYNSKDFDYITYWRIISKLIKCSQTVILFDKVDNLTQQQIPIIATHKMRVNGNKKSDIEGLSIYDFGSWQNKLDY